MEVHPPDHPVMTWRQFFTHMAIVVLGLLIAIALEQSVEKLHQRHEVKEAREALRVELKKNILLAREASIETRREHAIYLGDLQALQYLKAHPGAKLTDLPAPIFWPAYDYGQETTAWKTLRNSQVATHMPAEEMSKIEERYRSGDEINSQIEAVWIAMIEASAYSKTGKLATDLSPDELDTAIKGTERLISEEYKLAVDIENLCDEEASAGYSQCITVNELKNWTTTPNASDKASAIAAYGDAARRYYQGAQSMQEQMEALQKQRDALETKR